MNIAQLAETRAGTGIVEAGHQHDSHAVDRRRGAGQVRTSRYANGARAAGVHTAGIA